MSSPAALPSSTRAAPAKKRMLSAHTGSSSRAYESGLSTFRDSISASSSAVLSNTPPRVRERLPDVPGFDLGQLVGFVVDPRRQLQQRLRTLLRRGLEPLRQRP